MRDKFLIAHTFFGFDPYYTYLFVFLIRLFPLWIYLGLSTNYLIFMVSIVKLQENFPKIWNYLIWHNCSFLMSDNPLIFIHYLLERINFSYASKRFKFSTINYFPIRLELKFFAWKNKLSVYSLINLESPVDFPTHIVY